MRITFVSAWIGVHPDRCWATTARIPALQQLADSDSSSGSSEMVAGPAYLDHAMTVTRYILHV